MHWSTIIWMVAGFIGIYIVIGIILRLVGGYAPGWEIRCRRCGHKRDAAGRGDAPRTAVTEFAKVKSGDIVLPARSPDGTMREIRLRCVTKPDPAQ